ncbi:MAG: DUF6377 domain-containing protein [Muribaculaceae bacterium]
MRNGMQLGKLMIMAVLMLVAVSAQAALPPPPPIGELVEKNLNTMNCDELLRELDNVIGKHDDYSKEKANRVSKLEHDMKAEKNLNERYRKALELENEYETYVSDSAANLLNECLDMAEQMGNDNYIIDVKLRMAMVYSMSGMFVVADKIFQEFDYEKLDQSYRGLYCYARIRYCENIARDIDDRRFSQRFIDEIDWCREELMKMWSEGSVPYLKELANRYESAGRYKEAFDILHDVYNQEASGSHGYAMLAMSLAKCYGLMGKEELEKKYLIIAAITDIKLAIKENEALLALSAILYNEGDIERAYRYVKVCLADANFYNSHFKDSVIARTYSIVDSAYMSRMEAQRKKLQGYLVVISVIVVLLVVVLFESFKQRNKLMLIRAQLKHANQGLLTMNSRLDEANLIKERYVGYFMNQCSVYINKLDDFRKNVNRKIKTKQIEDLYVLSSRPMEKELEELYINFDRAFLNLYPDFIEQFNALLKPEARFEPEAGRLNITLRIYALMRMGITNMGQIAKFLNYSLQTVYNYKSKVKKDSLLDGDAFEEAVKIIGKISPKTPPKG